MYEIYWDDEALKDLKNLDKTIARKIVIKIQNYLKQDPENLGKLLNRQFKNLYRYRMGDYRVIYEIYRQEVHINVVKIGHRKDVYK